MNYLLQQVILYKLLQSIRAIDIIFLIIESLTVMLFCNEIGSPSPGEPLFKYRAGQGEEREAYTTRL